MKPSLHRPLAWRLAIAFLLLACAISTSAQNKNASSAGTPPTQPAAGNKNAAPAQPKEDQATNQPSEPDKKGVKDESEPKGSPVTLVSVSNEANPAPKPDPNQSAQPQPHSVDVLALGDRLRVTVSNRKELVAKETDLSRLVLLLNSYPMKGLPVYPGSGENDLIFELVPADKAASNLTDDEKKKLNETWNALLGGTGGFPPSPRDVTVGVSKDGAPLSSATSGNETRIKLQVVNVRWFWFYVVLLAFAIALFIYFARNSDLIRDPGPEPAGTDASKFGKPTKSYSLSRAQFAFWSFIIIGAYAFIWMVTTNQNTLNSFTLGIFGISAATTAAATLMDKSKRTAAEANMATLKQQGEAQLANNPAPPALPMGGAGAAAAPANPNADKIAALDAATRPPRSEGFWTDILSDDTGVTIHRFQNVVWTLVLGIIFIATVSKTLTMPNFDSTLLALMGISSATFVALKPTEKQDGSSNT